MRAEITAVLFIRAHVTGVRTPRTYERNERKETRWREAAEGIETESGKNKEGGKMGKQARRRGTYLFHVSICISISAVIPES